MSYISIDKRGKVNIVLGINKISKQGSKGLVWASLSIIALSAIFCVATPKQSFARCDDNGNHLPYKVSLLSTKINCDMPNPSNYYIRHNRKTIYEGIAFPFKVNNNIPTTETNKNTLWVASWITKDPNDPYGQNIGLGVTDWDKQINGGADSSINAVANNVTVEFNDEYTPLYVSAMILKPDGGRTTVGGRELSKVVFDMNIHLLNNAHKYNKDLLDILGNPDNKKDPFTETGNNDALISGNDVQIMKNHLDSVFKYKITNKPTDSGYEFHYDGTFPTMLVFGKNGVLGPSVKEKYTKSNKNTLYIGGEEDPVDKKQVFSISGPLDIKGKGSIALHSNDPNILQSNTIKLLDTFRMQNSHIQGMTLVSDDTYAYSHSTTPDKLARIDLITEPDFYTKYSNAWEPQKTCVLYQADSLYGNLKLNMWPFPAVMDKNYDSEMIKPIFTRCMTFKLKTPPFTILGKSYVGKELENSGEKRVLNWSNPVTEHTGENTQTRNTSNRFVYVGQKIFWDHDLRNNAPQTPENMRKGYTDAYYNRCEKLHYNPYELGLNALANANFCSSGGNGEAIATIPDNMLSFRIYTHDAPRSRYKTCEPFISSRVKNETIWDKFDMTDGSSSDPKDWLHKWASILLKWANETLSTYSYESKPVKYSICGKNEDNNQFVTPFKSLAKNTKAAPNDLFYKSYNKHRQDITRNQTDHKICGFIRWNHADGVTEQGWKSESQSEPACMEVPYHYDLGLTISSSASNHTETTGAMRFKYTLGNRYSKYSGNLDYKPSATPDLLKTQLVTYVIPYNKAQEFEKTPFYNATEKDNTPIKTPNEYKGRRCQEVQEVIDAIDAIDNYPIDCRIEVLSNNQFGFPANDPDGESTISKTKDVVLNLNGPNAPKTQPGDLVCTHAVMNEYWKMVNDVAADHSIRSNVSCTKIGKKPQIHVMGGDVQAKDFIKGSDRIYDITNNKITKSHDDSNFRIRGSYNQYNVVSGGKYNDSEVTSGTKKAIYNGKTIDFGSNGFTSTSITSTKQSIELVFANKDENNLGKSGISAERDISNVASGLNKYQIKKIPSHESSFNLGGIDPGVYQYSQGGQLTINGLTDFGKLSNESDKGSTRITVHGKTVAISGNIKHSASPNNKDISSLPTLTIISDGDIFIDMGVEHLDANLVAGGKIYTCAIKSSNSYNSVPDNKNGVNNGCTKQLHIRGAVYAKNGFKFNRTFGGGSSTEPKTLKCNGDNWLLCILHGFDEDTSQKGRTKPDFAAAPSEWIDYSPAQWLIPKYVDPKVKIESNQYKTTTVSELPARL